MKVNLTGSLEHTERPRNASYMIFFFLNKLLFFPDELTSVDLILVSVAQFSFISVLILETVQVNHSSNIQERRQETHVSEGEDRKYSDSPKKTAIKTDSRPTTRSFQFDLQLIHRASQPRQQLPQRGFSLCLEHYQAQCCSEGQRQSNTAASANIQQLAHSVNIAEQMNRSLNTCDLWEKKE